jgi:putative addiction module component (TIGR02574 family)
MSSDVIEVVKDLPLAERVELIDALWESITAEGYEPPLTPEQAAELDRRIEAHRNDPNDVVSWESIKQDFTKKYARR